MGLAGLQYFYGAVAALVALFFTLRSETRSKFVTFLVTFWILGAQIVHPPVFDIPIKALGGEMQMGRAIALLLLGYLLITSILRLSVPKTPHVIPYQKYFYLFFALLVFVCTIHFINGRLMIKEYVRLIDDSLRVLAMYLVLKRDADLPMLKILFKALMITAVLSSIVAIIQFFVSSDFLRVGVGRAAFGSYLRSDGLFEEEFINSYFLDAALIATLLWIPSGKKRIVLISLFFAGIFLSFHRMSWIVTFVIVLIFFAFEKRQMLWKLAFLGGVALLCTYFVVSQILEAGDALRRSSLYESRLSDDTMEGRYQQYAMVLKRTGSSLLMGIGTRKSYEYYVGMQELRLSRQWGGGEQGGIHNLYLDTLYLYGLPVFIVFCAFLLSLLVTYWKAYSQGFFYALFPLLFTIAYCIANLTNGLSFTSHFGVFFGLVLGCSAALLTRDMLPERPSAL